MDPAAKILTHEQVDAWMAAQRAAGLRVGFTCGSFDLLHPGHVQYLARARDRCDRLLVAVNSDASVARYKNPLRPITPEADRMYLVAALASVDAVTRLDDDRPLALIVRWKPESYLKGGDYRTESLRSGGVVREYGGAVESIPSDFATSTTATIERIAALAAHAAPERVEATVPRGLVLLDRDGTLIRDVPYLHEPDRVEVLPGVAEGLLQLQQAGLRLAIATNQQGIGLGYYTMQEFIAVNQRLLRELGGHGVRISRIYFCPHTLADQCVCRKPGPGMLARAMRDWSVTPARTFFVGNTSTDMEAGIAAGCRTVLVGSGTSSFASAVAWILEQR